ncbi:MAG: hypothetical protein WC714_10875 [Candidatus Obscuribacterales bacterium]|jgi:hypothetical protein
MVGGTVINVGETKGILASSLAFSLLLLGQQAALALPSDVEAVDALEKAKILAPNIRMNARVGQDEIEVATYKNPKANLSDCKIEALLIARTLMELAPGEVPRVVVYFYNSSSLSTFKQVAVTAGDVKAFASGSISKDELLKSLVVKEDSILDPSKRVASYLSEGQYAKRNKVNTVLRDDQIFISTALDSTLSERLLKLEALKLADQALEAAPVEYKLAQVTFVDHGQSKENRVVSISRSSLSLLGEALNTALQNVTLAAVKAQGSDGKVDIQGYELKDGLRKEERMGLLTILRHLDKEGVNPGKANIAEFLAIDDIASTSIDVELLDRIDKLRSLLTKLEENMESNKEFKTVVPANSIPNNSATKSGAPQIKNAPVAYEEGNADNLKARVLANPSAHVAAMEARLAQKTKSHVGEEHANFPTILQYVIDTLKSSGRAAEAAPFEERLAKLQAKKQAKIEDKGKETGK